MMTGLTADLHPGLRLHLVHLIQFNQSFTTPGLVLGVKTINDELSLVQTERKEAAREGVRKQV